MLPERREAVEAAARDLFAQHGYKKTSIADIAGRAGVAKSAIYLVADSKLALYFHVLHARVWGCVMEMTQGIDVAAPAGEQLAAAVREQLQWMQREPLVRSLLVERVEAGKPAWHSRFEELRRLGRSPLVQLVELGVRQGRFHAGADGEAVAGLLQDLQVCTVLLHPEEANADAPRWEVALELVLRGLAI